MDGWWQVEDNRYCGCVSDCCFILLFAALARWHWLVAEQVRAHPEDPLYVTYEMEWVEGVIRGEGSGRDIEELEMLVSRVGFRPRESEGHIVFVDYLYVGGVAVEVPWRATLKEVLRKSLVAAIARDYKRKAGGFYPLFGAIHSPPRV